MDMFVVTFLAILTLAGLALGGMYLEQYILRKRHNKHAH